MKARRSSFAHVGEHLKKGRLEQPEREGYTPLESNTAQGQTFAESKWAAGERQLEGHNIVGMIGEVVAAEPTTVVHDVEEHPGTKTRDASADVVLT